MAAMMGYGMPPGLMGPGAAAPGPNAALAAAKAWKLFVGQISFDIDESILHPYFSQFGTILELALPRTDGRSRGYAFITFSNQSEAQAAIDSANGAVIPQDPRARPLQVRYADQKHLR
jgi:RNA recognition motif-containing protein